MILTVYLLLSFSLPNAYCNESWRTEFEETCAKAPDAMALSCDELQALIGRCDRLQRVIEQRDETVRKVYLKRLQMCKNLYIYVLEVKKSETAEMTRQRVEVEMKNRISIIQLFGLLPLANLF
jgi:hypothetical protein